MSDALIIDGLIAVETPDTSGEVLDVKGCNIDTLPIDGGLNYEHKDEKEEGASANDIVGKCIKAKKIFSAKDCENDREKMYWDKFELPMIYGQFRLFNDDEEHQGARSLAAAMRSQDKYDEEQMWRFSIEGSTVQRDGNHLKETIARMVAITRKPANHASVTGVLKTVKAKTLLEDITEDAKKFEALTGFERLGGYGVAMPLEKTYTASMGDGGLTAPAGALQVEHIHGREKVKKELDKRGLLNVVKSILRDSDSLDAAKAAIKNELGDMSPEFVNLFDNLADGWVVKKSREDFLAKAEKPATEPAKESTMQERKGDDYKATLKERKGDDYKATLTRLKDQGATLPPIETAKPPHIRKVKKGSTYFDEDKGVLFAPGKAYKFYVPEDDSQYDELFQHPELQGPHDTALKNWVTLHRLYKAGKLPDEVVALAGMFSANSPNTDVPTQELAYAHWMDLLKQGMDLTDPDAEEKWGPEFEARAKSRKSPETDADLFGPGAPVRTKAGELPIVGLRQQKVHGVMSYGAMHGTIKHLLSQGASGRDIAGHLSEAKANNMQSEDNPGTTVGAGFAPKTIRYMLGMSGIGDIHVPDTHFIRHGFGLHKDDPTNQEIKSILWEARNEPSLAAMDRFYYRTHPAVKYTQNRLKQLGIDDVEGEHVIFPSFWAHWLSVAPHERLRGWTTGQASNEGTDHAVFFNSVKRALDKRDIPFDVHRLTKATKNTDSMPARIADAVHEIEQEWGPELAQFAFYSHMVPALLANSHHLQKVANAFEKLADLAKALVPQPAAIVDADKHGLPGLAHSPEQRNLVHGLDLNSTRLPEPGHMESTHVRDPGNFDQLADESLTNKLVRLGDLKYEPRLLTSPAGKVAFVKPNIESMHYEAPGVFSAAAREAAFHHLAKNFFGMGAHVPTTAAFKHPNDDTHMSAQEFVPDAGVHHTDDIIEHLGDTGVLDKASIMDTILHNPDRHYGNFLTSSKPPYLHLIDNGLSFAISHRRPFPPAYLAQYGGILSRNGHPERANLHPESEAWLKNLDPQKLRHQMEAIGLHPNFATESVRRLKEMQARIARGPATKQGIITAPFWGP